MNRRGILTSLSAGLAALTPAALSAKPKKRKRYTRPDGARCWHKSLVHVVFNRTGALVYLKRRRQTIADTLAKDDIFLDGDDVCVYKRS